MATFDHRFVDEFPRLSSPSTKTNALGPLHSVYVPAMEGTKIALDVLFPQAPAGATFPTVLIMTRYWRNKLGEDPNPWHVYFAERGFVTIHGDVRGTGASFGQWPYHRSRSETHDFTPIMDWIVVQPWSDGRIVGTGTSYSGNTADWMAERNHPALKVIVPRYADYDPYADVYFPGGVPNSYMGRTWGLRVKDLDLNIKRDSEGKLVPGVRPVDGPKGKELLQAALTEHLRVPSVWDGIQEIKYRDDQPTSWHGASMTDFGISSHMEQVKKSGLPCQNWASWMDTCTANGAIHRFLKLGDSSHVIIGPWSHGGRHAFDPLDPERDVTGPNYAVQQAEVLLFIQESLEGKWKSKQKRLSYFTCGQQRWKTTTIWPPANTHFEDWYFSPNSNLAKDPSVAGVDTYVVDFDVGTGKTTRWATGQDSTPVHYSDRLEVDKRLLCYTSSPLPHDVEITGHPVLTMFLTSTETDGAFIAYLELVAPDGKVLYLTEGQLRAVHRRVSEEVPKDGSIAPYHSYLRKDAMPLVPGELTEIAFALNPISVLVPMDYCIRLALAGADADVFTRVPAVGNPVLHMHRGQNRRSRITLPVINQGTQARSEVQN